MPGMPAGFASGPPPGGSISPSQLASQAAYTVLGNPTASPASPIATTNPVVSGSSTAARFLGSANNTAAAPTFLVEPAGNSGLYWDATNGVLVSVDGANRIETRVGGRCAISSNAASTVPILRLSNLTLAQETFVYNATPEGALTANPGALCLDATNGRLYIKRTGTGNTGWVQIDRCESGTYTPTFAILGNLDSISANGLTSYIRVGDQVFVSGSCNIDPTASGQITYTISLPIASNFTLTTDASGMNTARTAFIGLISADTTNDVATVQEGNTSTTAGISRFFFSYTVK